MKEIYWVKSFFKMSIMKMLLKAKEASEKKAFKKINHEFKQFNFTWSLDLHLMHTFSLTLQYFFF